MPLRLRRFLAAIVCTVFLLGESSYAGTEATVTGLITDPHGLSVVGATVQLTNLNTNITYITQTNEVGIYRLTVLPPGIYRANVTKVGFKSIVKSDVELHVQDTVSMNFSLQVGSVTESITVAAGAPMVNTESAVVSTVVTREQVENMPLNGRSFQTLLMLTPGVVLSEPTNQNQGQFNTNGQRSDANYFTVDGVSANTGMVGGNTGLAGNAGGAVPAFSVSGGTNTIVSADAMQEFRVQTSSFAPEFGRTPGGQVSIVTRSGSNEIHGTVFDYFRNDVLDATDWFANHNGLPKPKERQNDFGGVLGGPLIRDNTFFFLSYEGLRLRQPKTAQTQVPDVNSRQVALAGIQPYLNAFPLPNGPGLGGGLAQFNSSYSDPSALDNFSVRVDHRINSKLNLFGRYSFAPSEAEVRAPNLFSLSNLQTQSVDTQTLTLGLTQAVRPNIGNELRANYTNVRAGFANRLDNFGGAAPVPDSVLFPQGFSSKNAQFTFNGELIAPSGGPTFLVGTVGTNEQRQVNIVDNVAVSTGSHQLKFGIDYRWLAPFSSPSAYSQFVAFSGIDGVPNSAVSGTAFFAFVQAFQGNALLSQNVSLYGQDTWKLTRRLTLAYGLRWDVDPAIKGKNSASEPFTVKGLDNPATLTLAPRRTPLYDTTYGNVAPRLGVAYQLRQREGSETVLRGGVGVFYDLGIGVLGNVTSGFPYTATNFFFSPSFPLTAAQATPPALSLTPPVSLLFVTEPNLKLPRTYHWNVSLEQSLGANQTVSATYIGALGRDLLRPFFLFFPNPDFGQVFVATNTGKSDYHALQLKFQRRLSGGLQALASYTFSHSIDNSSNDSGFFTASVINPNANIDRGNSDFDVRHSLAGALSYEIPAPGKRRVTHALLGGWAVDSFVIARSALPVDLVGGTFIAGNTFFNARPNIVPDVPFYLFGSQNPGGKAINPAAFTAPPNGQQGDLRRNALRGFGAWQVDFALRRQFRITERLGIQFRGEFFNVFNHPNFGNPTNVTIGFPQFGVSTQTLASRLGGLNPLYQIGGPRSIQLALKLQF